MHVSTLSMFSFCGRLLSGKYLTPSPDHGTTLTVNPRNRLRFPREKTPRVAPLVHIRILHPILHFPVRSNPDLEPLPPHFHLQYHGPSLRNAFWSIPLYRVAHLWHRWAFPKLGRDDPCGRYGRLRV